VHAVLGQVADDVGLHEQLQVGAVLQDDALLALLHVQLVAVLPPRADGQPPVPAARGRRRSDVPLARCCNPSLLDRHAAVCLYAGHPSDVIV
jgi:hypothetical protein